jgi:hypothetical protein
MERKAQGVDLWDFVLWPQYSYVYKGIETLKRMFMKCTTFLIYSPSLDFGRFFLQFLVFYTIGRSPWTGDQPVARPLRAQRTAQTQNKHTQTSMPQVGFEPTIPVFERPKTVHALDRAATVIGTTYLTI